jgi:hypothetical protein
MSGLMTNGLPAMQGAALTGAELIAVDTQLASGVTPQSAAVSSLELSKFLRGQAQTGPNFRNFLDGGDFSLNPWQRGTSFSGIAATPTYTADRWFGVGNASASISVSQVAIAGQIAGFNNALQFGRTSGNGNTGLITLGQVLESADSYRAQGQPMTLNFWARAGANFSAVGAALTVQIVTGQGSNDSAARMVSGAWSGQVAALNTTQALTTGWARYSLTTPAVIPVAATQLGVSLAYSPMGTAAANDWFQVAGVQLEVGPAATAFEFRDAQVELEICQRYYYQANEPASGVIVAVGGAVAAANAQVYYMALPVQMRAPPSVGVTTGAFKVAAAAAAATATGLAPGATHTPNAISLVSTLTQSVGLAATLQGGGGSGLISASADF